MGTKFQKILAAIDALAGKEEAQSIIHTAILIGETYNASVKFITVAPPLKLLGKMGARSDATSFVETPSLEPKEKAQELKNYETVLKSLVSEASMRSPPAFDFEYEVREGDAKNEILDCAERSNADLIILGRHKHNILENIFSAMPSKDVPQLSKCSVFLLSEEIWR